ncbi:Plasmodium exported protein, unknown function [Plasmodium reichenowi]|uniref:Rifin n=1 Tax=Plasmodium reichenowi TaxID=5854 RepID=A0A060RT09_PLARE|nr:Plasmodium exported protein, unknown function [Plasmodium reichenowi]
MIFIYFKILFFSLLLDTFISSHTNIPRTNKNNSQNATVNKTPVDTIPDLITLDYIRDQLKQIKLIKDEIIKEKLKKIKYLKKKNKDKNKKDHNDTKDEIEKLEKEILDTKILCEDYIKNELKEISLLKDQIVKDKIEKYHWNRGKLIDYELKKLFLEQEKKKLLESYEQYQKEEQEKKKLKEKILKEKLIKRKLKIEKFKNESIIYKLFLEIKNYLVEYINDGPDVELTCAKYFQDLFKKKKGKRKTFFELWSSFYEIIEEKVDKYQIGGYTIGVGIIAAIAKSIHSIVATPMACIKASALSAKLAAGTIQCCKVVTGTAKALCGCANVVHGASAKCIILSGNTFKIFSCTKAAGTCCTASNVVSNCCKLKSLEAACTTIVSPDPATKVVAIIIIVILIIVLMIYLYFLIEKSGILENEHVQKVLSKLGDYYNSQQVLYII